MSRYEDDYNAQLHKKAPLRISGDATAAVLSEVLRDYSIMVGEFDFKKIDDAEKIKLIQEALENYINEALEKDEPVILNLPSLDNMPDDWQFPVQWKEKIPKNLSPVKENLWKKWIYLLTSKSAGDLENLQEALKRSPYASEFFISQLIRKQLPRVKDLDVILPWLNRQESIMNGLLPNNLIQEKYPFLTPIKDDLGGAYSFALITKLGQTKFFEKDGQLMVEVSVKMTFKEYQMVDEDSQVPVIDTITVTTSLSDIAEKGETEKRYALCFDSIKFENKDLETLLEMDPKKAEKQISLHRKMLFDRFFANANKVDVTELVKKFDENLREKLQDPKTDCRDMNLSSLDLTEINLSQKSCSGVIIDADTKLAGAILPANFFSIVKYQLTKKQITDITITRASDSKSTFVDDNARSNFSVKKTDGPPSNFYEYLETLPEIRQLASEKQVANKKAFQDFSPEKDLICIAWLKQELAVDEETAKNHVAAYKQGELNFINNQLGDFYQNTVASLGAAQIRMNLDGKISTQYVKDNGQVKLIQTFTPFFEDTKIPPADLDNPIGEILGELGNFTCVFVLNDQKQYELESAQCDNQLLYSLLMKTEKAPKSHQYIQVIFNVIKNHVMKLNNLSLREKVEKLIDISKRLKLPGVDLSNLDLSNADLSQLDLTKANLIGANLTKTKLTKANLTGAKLGREQIIQIIKGGRKDLSGVNLFGVDLSGVNFSDVEINDKTILIGTKLSLSTVTVKYCNAEITNDDVQKVFSSLYVDQEYAVRFKHQDIFMLLRYIQENPEQHFSKAADRELSLMAIRKLAKAPADAKVDAFNAAGYLSQWVEAVNKKGLHAPEISQVLQYSEARVHGKSVEKKRFTSGEDSKISFGLLENAKGAVINVEQTLSEKETGPCFITPLNFAALIAGILKKMVGDTKINCIQMPLADGDHYMQLQIYKTTDGIGARVIDSTANPFHDPTDFVRKLLIENREQLKAVLGAKSNTVTVGEVVRTNEQLRLGDKKCGIYVAAGMKAAAEKVLADGAEFLSSDDKVKNAVRYQHHLVSKTEPMGCLFGMVNVKLPEVTRASSPVTATSQNTEKPPSTTAAALSPSAKVASTDNLENDGFLKMHKEAKDDDSSGSKKGSDDRGDSRSSDEFVNISGFQVDRQTQSVTPIAHTRIMELLDEKNMTPKILQKAVEEALANYKNNRGWTLNFFRQLSSAGKDWAADAEEKIKAAVDAAAKQNVAREIAREILFMGVKADDQAIEVKHNSRVHHLLMAMETNRLIQKVDQINLKDLAYAGREFKAEAIKAVGASVESVNSPALLASS